MSGSLASPAPVAFLAASWPERARRLTAAGLGGSIGAIAAAQGGYFPSAWGWSALGFLWAAIVALLAQRRVRIRPAGAVLLALLTGLLCWTALSILWASAPGRPIAEVERTLIYVAAALVVVAVVQRRLVGDLLGGLLTGIALVCLYALATRLLPERFGTFDPFGGNRLNAPLGYWNALGLFATIGLLLALGFAAHGRTLAGRVAASATLPVLASTLYFTFSRGAWVALAAGLAVAVAADPRRLRLLTALVALLPGPAVAVVLGARADALTAKHPVLGPAIREGHRLALWLALLVVLAAGSALVLALLERRVTVPRTIRRAYAVVLVALALAGLGAVFAVYGSPPTLARKAYASFRKPPVAPENLGRRLFSLSSNGRIDLWHVAWLDAGAHPVLGAGAGTYETYWYRHRPSGQNVRDAHNLYIETLAELGPPGLALLAAALAVPFVAAVRTRRRGLAAVALGGYAAFVLHAAVDWDWEVPAVTLAGLACGLAVVIASRHHRPGRALPLRTRWLVASLLLVPAAFAFVALVGNSAATSASAAADRGDWAKAAREAHRAADWAPWAADPWRQLARAQSGAGRRAAAARSLQRAIERDPNDYRLWVELSFVTRGPLYRKAVAGARRLNPLLLPRPGKT